MEVEREFLDALSVVVSSGYYLDQDDFISLLRILRTSEQSEHVVERAKLHEFITLAADLLGFDVDLISEMLTEPWEHEATELATFGRASTTNGFRNNQISA